MFEAIRASWVQKDIDAAALRFAETGEEQIVELSAAVLIADVALTIPPGVSLRGTGPYPWSGKTTLLAGGLAAQLGEEVRHRH